MNATVGGYLDRSYTAGTPVRPGTARGPTGPPEAIPARLRQSLALRRNETIDLVWTVFLPPAPGYSVAMIERRAEVRDAAPGDATSLSGIFRESWQLAYAGIIPHPHLAAMIARRDDRYWRRTFARKPRPIVLEASGALAGYAAFGRARTQSRYEGEIFELYLSPVYQGLGLGERLFESARVRLDEMRIRGLVVWALSDNIAACDFYERRGGRPVATVIECFGNARLEKTAFAWPG